MANKKVKVKDHENLTDANILKVISLLEGEKPITKKEACEILNIAYNTTRLTSIIDNYKHKVEHDKKMRERNRGKPISEDEIKDIVKMYLSGSTVSDIAQTLFRPTNLIKSTVEKLGIPKKPSLEERVVPSILPEQCIADSFTPGQQVWSAVYHAPCEVIEEMTNINYEAKHSSKCYKIYVYEPLDDLPDYASHIKKGGFSAYSLAYNLGSLEHLSNYYGEL